LTAAPLTGANFYVSPTAPTAASDNSLWFNTQQQESKLYVKYVNNWIGVQ
jgi:hypothetical protein